MTSIENSTSYNEGEIIINVNTSNNSDFDKEVDVKQSDNINRNITDTYNEIGEQEKVSVGVRSSFSTTSEEGFLVDVCDSKISSDVDMEVINSAQSNSNKASLSTDEDKTDRMKIKLKAMSLEELKEEETWLEKAIVARIKYLKKDEQNW